MDKIDKLAGEVSVEKTIVEYTPDTEPSSGVARTVDFIGVVVDIFDKNYVAVTLDNPVPVYGDLEEVEDFKGIVGAASLYMVENKLVADIMLNYYTPHRLAIEAGINIYPYSNGTIVKYNDYSEINIKGLFLDTQKKKDSRIDPLKI